MKHLMIKSLSLFGAAIALAGVGVTPGIAATTAQPPVAGQVKSADTGKATTLLVDGSKKEDLAKTLVVLHNTKNTRDLGGYQTADGKWQIRHYQLLRSDNLNKLDSDDVKTFTDKYRVKSVVDLRTPGQVKSAPDVAIPGAKETYISILGPHAYTDGGGDGDFYNQRLTFGYPAITGYRQFLNMLAVNNGGSTLYHCSSGKDRTGIATVLIMAILGMDKQTIVNDFMLSQYTGRTVKIEWISQYYRDIEKNYGSLQNYIDTALAISPTVQAKLRAKYLVSTDGKQTPYPAPSEPAQPNPTPTLPSQPETPKPQPETKPEVVTNGDGDQVTKPKKKAKQVKILKTKKLHTKRVYRVKAHKPWFKDAKLKHAKGKTPKTAKKWRLVKSEKVKIKHKTYTYYQIKDASGHTAWILNKYVTKK
ncbi:tyrosine-protein phosphatase [Levilactobacillus hammesii]|nr:tyrosine-protein phosphatase [Levilactobacillus hammesii]